MCRAVRPVVIACFATAFHAGGAPVGQAAAGQEYAPVCCPQLDCHLAAETEVRMVPEGYEVTFDNGERDVLSVPDVRIRPSSDGRFHVCTGSRAQPGMDATSFYRDMSRKRVKCLYVPMTS